MNPGEVRLIALGAVLERIAAAIPEDALLGWARIGSEALQSRFPRTWRDFVPRVGDGLRQLLQPGHEADLEEARHTCEHGLLVSQAPSLKLLQITGKRLLQDAIEPFEKLTMP